MLKYSYVAHTYIHTYILKSSYILKYILQSSYIVN